MSAKKGKKTKRTKRKEEEPIKAWVRKNRATITKIHCESPLQLKLTLRQIYILLCFGYFGELDYREADLLVRIIAPNVYPHRAYAYATIYTLAGSRKLLKPHFGIGRLKEPCEQVFSLTQSGSETLKTIIQMTKLWGNATMDPPTAAECVRGPSKRPREEDIFEE